MTKVFIDSFHCKTSCEIFTGKDALHHALYWIKTGKQCTDANHLYGFKYPLIKAASWRNIPNNKAKLEYSGIGNHAKMYETNEHLIFSSQNNCHSPLFEFAIVYSKKPKLSSFFNNTFSRIKSYRDWWYKNRTYGTNN